MLDPDKGRARIHRDGDALIVDIPAKRHPFAATFLGFWLCGWAMGWLAAAGSLLQGGSLFLLFWLGAWTAGGLVALAAFLWMVAGRETIRFDTSTVHFIRDIPLWRQATRCRFDALSNMRPDPHRSIMNQGQQNFWLRKAAGAIKVDYGIHTLGFGLELDEAEARKLVATLTAVFPELGP